MRITYYTKLGCLTSVRQVDLLRQSGHEVYPTPALGISGEYEMAGFESSESRCDLVNFMEGRE